MAAEDWFEPYSFDEEPHAVDCKFCGRGDLEWDEVKIDGEWAWRLIDEFGDIHNCRGSALPAQAEDFEVQHEHNLQAKSRSAPPTRHARCILANTVRHPKRADHGHPAPRTPRVTSNRR